jgi:hypothetical protein
VEAGAAAHVTDTDGDGVPVEKFIQPAAFPGFEEGELV